MARERAGVQTGYGHATAIECSGHVNLLVTSGPSSAKLEISTDDARHLATLLRRIARRVERQGLA